MDIVVTGRQLTISDSFRAHIEDKIAKVERLAPRARACRGPRRSRQEHAAAGDE